MNLTYAVGFAGKFDGSEMPNFDKFTDALAQNGRRVRKSDKICPPQSKFLDGKFKNLDENFYRFVCYFEASSDTTDAVWFASAGDYSSDAANMAEFHWADFEKDSLECAANDAQRAAVGAFWSECLLFLFSVRDKRCFADIFTQGADAGKVVFSVEPMYEDARIIAHGFDEFIALFLAALRDKNAAKHPLFCFA